MNTSLCDRAKKNGVVDHIAVCVASREVIQEAEPSAFSPARFKSSSCSWVSPGLVLSLTVSYLPLWQIHRLLWFRPTSLQWPVLENLSKRVVLSLWELPFLIFCLCCLWVFIFLLLNFVVCFGFFFEAGSYLIVQALNSLYSPDWSQIYNPPTSAFQVLNYRLVSPCPFYCWFLRGLYIFWI